MYKCCTLKRFCYLLILDAIIFAVCGLLFLALKALLSSADSTDPAVRLPVIMYHSVCDREPSEYSVTPDQVESDLRWLSEHGYTTVTAEDVIAHTNYRTTLPKNSVMITLDDGFYNNYSELLPLLEKYDMCAVISIVGTYADNDAQIYPHDPGCSYLTWDDIKMLEESGRIEFGNHTYAMHSLNGSRIGCGISDGESEASYRDSFTADILTLQTRFRENGLSAPVVFAYPFGRVSHESLPIIRENGFLMTFTCRELPNIITRDPDCLYGIGRYNRSGLYSTEEFMQKLF